ncbi:MAG: hypothetical protein AAGB14_06225, partial [Verrucomicrobiota bacterium]
AGIRKAISVQEADRLAFALEKELVNLSDPSSSDYQNRFDKAYQWIEGSTNNNEAVLVYQYRAQIAGSLRADGTREPYTQTGGAAGEDFVIQPIARRKDDPELENDLDALEGRVYAAKMVQLVFENGELVRGDEGKIKPPDGQGTSSNAETYPEAVIAFAAEFHLLPNSSYTYINSKFNVAQADQPMFIRNLAVRR